jgi:hypothetical protein
MVVRDENRTNIPNIHTRPGKATCNTVAGIDDVMLAVYR